MASNKLAMGDSLTGLIIDGVAGTPYVSGLLTFDPTHGVRVEVPYISEDVDQFGSVSQWANDMQPPSNLLFVSDRQNITLYGCRVVSMRQTLFGNSLSTVKINPREVVLKDRDGDHRDELKVVEMRSRIDGLSEWTNFRSTQVKTTSGADGFAEKVTVEVESVKPVVWTVGDVTFSLENDWSTIRNDLGVEVHEWVYLHTSFTEPRSCSEHLAEQRKFVSLLALMHGTAICFRKHEVRDSRFSTRKNIEGELYSPFYELISMDTVRDYQREYVSKRYSRPLNRLAAVGQKGLEQWFQSYAEWERVIQPVAGTIQRAQSFVEDHVVNACIGLEAAGHILGSEEGKEETYHRGRATLATLVYRCLLATQLDVAGIAVSRAALARGIAKIYNDTKHYDRYDYPPGDHSYLIGKVALLVARLLSLRLFDADVGPVSKMEVDQALLHITDNMRNLGLLIDEGGRFISLADAPSSSENC